MGELLAGIGTSHAPGFRAWPQAAPPQQLSAIETSMAELRRRIQELRPDALVLITAEHWANFSLANMPCFCVGLADSYQGPVESWLRMSPSTVPGAADLGQRIVRQALDDGVDVSYSYELLLDHGSMVPLSYLTPDYALPVVPIIQNCLQQPMPRARRSYALGTSIARAVAASDQRVVVVGSGGLSHWPAEREHGQVNQAWDRAFLELVTAGAGDELAAWTDEQILEGGSGAAEVRNWITMLGAVPGRAFDVLFYESVPAFATGTAAAISR